MGAALIYRPARSSWLNKEITLALNPSNFVFALVKDGSSFMDEHPAVMDDFTNLNEPTGAAYIRTIPSGITVTLEAATEKVFIPSDLVVAQFNLLPEDSDIAGAILYWKVGAGTYGADATNKPLIGYELGTPHKVRAAETYEFPLPSDGLADLPSFGEKIYAIGRKNLLEGYVNYATETFEFSLFMEGSNFLSVANPSTLAALTNEFDGSGYTPISGTFTLSEDTTRDRIVISMADIDFGNLGNGTGKIIGGVFSIPASINGVADTLVYGLRLLQPIDPGGGNFTFPMNDDGVAYI